MDLWPRTAKVKKNEWKRQDPCLHTKKDHRKDTIGEMKENRTREPAVEWMSGKIFLASWRSRQSSSRSQAWGWDATDRVLIYSLRVLRSTEDTAIVGIRTSWIFNDWLLIMRTGFLRSNNSNKMWPLRISIVMGNIKGGLRVLELLYYCPLSSFTHYSVRMNQFWPSWVVRQSRL